MTGPPATPRSGNEAPTWRVFESDCIEAMRAMPESSVDAVVCDPPYGLGFMGKEWDAAAGPSDHAMRRNPAVDAVNAGVSRQARDARAFQAWCEAWATEALRVLRPAGYGLIFGGTRTYHRLVVGLEDAGFEVRDQLDWIYGSGFPKHPSALKPAHEPIALVRKAGSRSEPLNIEECRIGTGEGGTRAGEASAERRYTDKGSTSFAPTPGPRGGDEAGRWPANVVLDDEAAAILDGQSGTLRSGAHSLDHGRSVPRLGHGGVYGDHAPPTAFTQERDADEGGASRFFYCAKPDTAERSNGLVARNPHPTVKPIALMCWLVRLVTPPGGTVLDPFTGSGTTGIAALREGLNFIGIERDSTYAEVARERIRGDAPLLNLTGEIAA